MDSESLLNELPNFEMESDLESVEEEIKNIEESLGDKIKVIDEFFNEFRPADFFYEF